ncbi:sulfite oxidase heme-binding subunit YedZ [Thalassotalea profundi]|uniref:Protein-methionine-sulfoxide reductase heme-binding subunit MsrQ n=1 Tax=Thalassotalea profundi TaxID=2036687 RepID=A0ABQ3IWT3_9GAMM|nr:protein-methionine-sulfoxide reductase heme-binding subunit MsrQ [Thalassotalea profundi]GHE92255.1 protein-methionine-sulfoxide reductase heme-binding subunit MsrQ [Thalassotalea profundi]
MPISLNQHTMMIKIAIHFLCLVLLVNQYWLALNDDLGADPVEAILHFTGIGAFNLLILSLSISPLVRIFKFTSFIHYRRLLGLYCFLYVLAHLLSFLAFEVQFDWQLFLNEIIERPYMTFGMIAFVILLLLTITSIDKIKRQMRKSWQKLHHWVYLVIVLASIHFYMSVKSDITEPLVYALISLILLSFRWKKLFKYFR